jgi:biotin carboxyl carrier protein
MKYEVLIDGHSYQVSADRTAQGYSCTVDGEPFELDVAQAARDVLSILHEGRSYEARRESSAGGENYVLISGHRFQAELRDPRSLRSRRASLGAAAGPVGIHAPMPGKVVRLLAATGDEVEAGQGLLVVEAMKMQNEIKSSKKGKVIKIAVKEASAVNAGDLLAVVE